MADKCPKCEAEQCKPSGDTIALMLPSWTCGSHVTLMKFVEGVDCLRRQNRRLRLACRAATERLWEDVK